MNNTKKATGVLLAIAMLALAAYAQTNATEERDINAFSGIALDDLITIASSILATILFGLTVMAYMRSRSHRIASVSVAFFLYAVKGFIVASDAFLPAKSAWADPAANFLDFVILLCFFIGIMRK